MRPGVIDAAAGVGLRGGVLAFELRRWPRGQRGTSRIAGLLNVAGHFEPTRVATHLRRAAAAAGRLGYGSTEASHLDTLGRVLEQAGQIDEAIETFERVIEIGRTTRQLRLLALGRVHLGRILRGHGDPTPRCSRYRRPTIGSSRPAAATGRPSRPVFTVRWTLRTDPTAEARLRAVLQPRPANTHPTSRSWRWTRSPDSPRMITTSRKPTVCWMLQMISCHRPAISSAPPTASTPTTPELSSRRARRSSSGQRHRACSPGRLVAYRRRALPGRLRDRRAPLGDPSRSRTPFSRPQTISRILSRWFVDGRGFAGRRFPPALRAAKPQVSGVVMHQSCAARITSRLAKVLVDGHFLRGGAGGNRTTLHPIPLYLLRGLRPWSGPVFE